MQDIEIVFYVKEDGVSPIKNFLDTLDIKMRTKVVRTIELLQSNGNELREPYSKPLSNGIFELRVKQSNNIVRLLYFFTIGNKIILTNGFIKKSQKTPSTEIELAIKYKADYLYRLLETDP